MAKRMMKMAMAAAALTMVAGAAYAQRDPAYQEARTQGLIGEKPDGYLGFVGSPSPAIRALVDDLNIKRKAAYTRSAAGAGSTVEQFAFTTGCRLILPDIAWGKISDARRPMGNPRQWPAHARSTLSVTAGGNISPGERSSRSVTGKACPPVC